MTGNKIPDHKEHPGGELAVYDEQEMEFDTGFFEAENGAEPDQPAPQEEVREYVETEDEAELRSLIFSTSDVYEELLDVPEWKTPDGRVMQVLLRAFSAAERAQYYQSLGRQKLDKNGMPEGQIDLKRAQANIVIMACRHPKTKKLLFKPGDRDSLMTKNGRAIERISLRISKISALDKASLDELQKN